MRRRLTLALLVGLTGGIVGAPSAGAQALEEDVAPGGRLRLEVRPIFTRWDERFGRTEDGETGREALGDDLTTVDALDLFPGSASLRSALGSLVGNPGYAPVLGETAGRVAHDVTRVEFGAHLGITDWLTVGAVLPWTRTRSDVDVAFRPDTLGGDLGVNPITTDPQGVDAFLTALANAQRSAAAHAQTVCGASPSSPECAAAEALSDRTAGFFASSAAAYGATPFFPIAGSGTATSIEEARGALEAELLLAGLDGIAVSMPFAARTVDENAFLTAPSVSASGVGSRPLGSVRSPWSAGDVEISVGVRLLSGASRDPLTGATRSSYHLVGTLIGRLPTGRIDDPDVLLDVGTGDGQTDVEARLAGVLTLGRRFGVRAGGRYGVQMSRTLVRRVAAPETVLAPRSTRQPVEWDPGSYFGVELAPAWHFSPELSLAAEYRVFRKWRDTYTLVPGSDAAVDPYLLEDESGVTLHEVGGSLRFDALTSWLGGGASRPVQLHARVLTAVSGGGGQTPVTTRVEFGVRLFRRIWGAR